MFRILRLLHDAPPAKTKNRVQAPAVPVFLRGPVRILASGSFFRPAFPGFHPVARRVSRGGRSSPVTVARPRRFYTAFQSQTA